MDEIHKKLKTSPYRGCCKNANVCKKSCGNKNLFKVYSPESQTLCPYTLEIMDLIVVVIPQQLELFFGD